MSGGDRAAAGAASAAAVAASARRLRAGGHAPAVAVLLGSGWGPFADLVQDGASVDYGELPAFPTPGVRGHAGRVVLGRIGGHEVAVLAGRVHAYEADAPTGMTGAIRALAAAGVRVLVQTCAAGSLSHALPPGTVMAIADHLNLPQRSPLAGEDPVAAAGDAQAAERRFVAMTDAYEPALRAQARAAAAALGQPLPEGVYAWVLGPQFETPAEIRMLQLLGAQAVGMSTVPETIAARHAGLRVLALALITNMAAGLSDERLSHAHTLAAAQAAGADAAALLHAVVAGLRL